MPRLQQRFRHESRLSELHAQTHALSDAEARHALAPQNHSGRQLPVHLLRKIGTIGNPANSAEITSKRKDHAPISAGTSRTEDPHASTATTNAMQAIFPLIKPWKKTAMQRLKKNRSTKSHPPAKAQDARSTFSTATRPASALSAARGLPTHERIFRFTMNTPIYRLRPPPVQG